MSGIEIAQLLIGALTVLLGIITLIGAAIVRRLDRIEKRIDDHMDEEEASLAAIAESHQQLANAHAATREHVSFIAGQLGIGVPPHR